MAQRQTPCTGVLATKVTYSRELRIFLMCLGSVLTTWSTRPSKENPDPLDEACRMHPNALLAGTGRQVVR